MWPLGRWLGLGRETPLGRRGEDRAARHLRRLGLKVLARNYRCPSGEADIIALEKPRAAADGDGTIVFVEVKTRASDQTVQAESAVDSHKRRQILNVARYYLSKHAADGDFSVRFDVVAVIIPPAGKPQIRHTPDAFSA